MAYIDIIFLQIFLQIHTSRKYEYNIVIPLIIISSLNKDIGQAIFLPDLILLHWVHHMELLNSIASIISLICLSPVLNYYVIERIRFYDSLTIPLFSSLKAPIGH